MEALCDFEISLPASFTGDTVQMRFTLCGKSLSENYPFPLANGSFCVYDIQSAVPQHL